MSIAITVIVIAGVIAGVVAVIAVARRKADDDALTTRVKTLAARVAQANQALAKAEAEAAKAQANQTLAEIEFNAAWDAWKAAARLLPTKDSNPFGGCRPDEG